MDLRHDFTVPAPVDEVWAAFNHLELVASCFPGASLTSVDGHDVVGWLRVKLGPQLLAYQGSGRFLERHLGGRHTVIQAHGQEVRGKGDASLKVTTSFAAVGDQTVVHVVTDLSFTGPAAALPAALVHDAADRLVAQFAERVSAGFAEGLGAEALRLDADPDAAGPLGVSATSSSTTYAYSPPAPASQTDWEVLRRLAPVWGRQLGLPLLGAAGLWWLVRKVSRGVSRR